MTKNVLPLPVYDYEPVKNFIRESVNTPLVYFAGKMLYFWIIDTFFKKLQNNFDQTFLLCKFMELVQFFILIWS